MTNNSAGKAVEQAHAELLNFIGPAGLLLDYRGEIPTARDCAECRPNAKGWWTPIENGPMFTAPWLVAVCRRAEISGLAEDRALSRRLARGLLRAASLSTTPGFIARGEGAERGCHYPIGSMDQTLPWFYGLYVYQKSGGADPEVADNARKTMLAVADAIAKNDWKCPCEAPFDAETCGDFRNEGAPFRYANWRSGYMWREQKTIADSDRVASTGDEAILGTRKKFERAYMTAPLSAAAICALAGESPQEVAKTLAHYDYATLNLSEFFLAEVAWFTR